MSNFGVFVFFENETTNATSEVYFVKDGGYRELKATGTFDGATITVEVDFDDNDFAPVLDYQFTEPVAKYIQPLRPGMRLRAVVTDAGPTTNVTFKLM